ncbi:ABC transporter substrate-binding protein [Cohnella silvisoli]|uniref:Extracellular solute-binding protein n=1 Tax=Cohnella silvisoli TaxID=2873699 RepID=A0ABV1KXD3_9BACL|nr:extracellular solute-binding protein [Cohnella silvisoli]MCD9023643.1 extracellular solute-binding protein [Cohnella silvisoli]
MRKPLLIVLVLMLCVSSLLSACGGNKNNNASTSTSASPTESAKASEASASPEASKPAEQVELKVSGYKSGAEIGAIPELNEKFMKENPDIKVTYEGMPGAQYKDFIKTRLVAGDASDVMLLHPGAEIVDYAKAGYLMDLSGEPWVPDFTVSAIDAASGDGKVYGTPNDTVMLGVYYNKDIFAKLNLKVPTDWDQFLAACEAIKASGVTPIAIGNNDGWMTLAALFVMAPAMIYAKDPDFDKKLNARETKFAGSWDEMNKAWFSLDTKGYLTPKSTGISLDQAQTDFAKGKAAMYIDGTWSLAGIKGKNEALNLGMFAMPSNKAGEDVYVSAAVGTVWTINKSTEKADAAKKYLAFWAKEENQSIWAKSGGAFLTLQGKKSDADPAFEDIAGTLATGKAWRFLNQAWAQDAATTEMMKSAQGVYLKALTPEQMLKNMDDAWDKAAKLQK